MATNLKPNISRLIFSRTINSYHSAGLTVVIDCMQDRKKKKKGKYKENHKVV